MLPEGRHVVAPSSVQCPSTSCPGHNSQTTRRINKKLYRYIDLNKLKCGAQKQKLSLA